MRHRWARAVSPPLIACVDSTCKRHALVMPVHTRWHAVLDKPCCLPTACASPCAPSRQAAEASCPTAVPPLVHTFFPSACGQRVGASARAGAVPAAAVCSGCALRCPRQGCQPQRGGRQPWLAYERFPKDTGCTAVSGPTCTALRRQGRSVTRAEDPCHRRPWLRHQAHRRGEASAVSSPPQACTGVVESRHLSAQPPADQSVQRLIPRLLL